MPYLIIFIISLLLSVNPAAQDEQTTLKITFDSASLVESHDSMNNWDYSATVNGTLIDYDRPVTLTLEAGEQVRIKVSANKPGTTFDSEKTNSTSYIYDSEAPDFSAINIYGSNVAVIDAAKLTSDKPLPLNIYTDVKAERGDDLITPSAKWAFKFTVESR